MGSINSLLGIVRMKKASGLALASEEVPSLIFGGSRTPLTMPRLSKLMLGDLVAELLSPLQREALASEGKVESIHDSGAEGVYTLKAAQVGERITIVLKAAPKGIPTTPTTTTPTTPIRSAPLPPGEVDDRRSAGEGPRPPTTVTPTTPRVPPSAPIRSAPLPPGEVDDRRSAGEGPRTPNISPPSPPATKRPGAPSNLRGAVPTLDGLDPQVVAQNNQSLDRLPLLTALAPPRSQPGAGPIERAIDEAIALHASDLLISAGTVPVLRVAGELMNAAAAAPVDEPTILHFCEPFVQPPQRQAFAGGGSADFAIVHGQGASEVRLRANLFRHLRGAALALRPIWSRVPTLEELHLPSSLHDLVKLRNGLVLVAGATGAGKSTTVAALLDEMNRNRACHIVTLEDPVEYVYPPGRAVVHQREVGTHVGSFAHGLRAALRENPDVILVGEIRDAETIRLALTAAETGHLVLSTLHSGSAVMAIERIIDVFSDSEKLHIRQQLSGVLRNVVAQQLVATVDGGRVPALEILTVNYAVGAQIREGRTHMLATQMEIGGDHGMVPLERSLADLVRAGRVARKAAIAAAADRDAVLRLLDEKPRR